MINITEWISSNMIKDMVGEYIAENIDITSKLEDLTLEILDDYSVKIENAIDEYIEGHRDDFADQIKDEIADAVSDLFG